MKKFGLVVCLRWIAVFGRVIDGMETVKYIENVPKGYGDKPVHDVIVKDSGELPADDAATEEKVKDEL